MKRALLCLLLFATHAHASSRRHGPSPFQVRLDLGVVQPKLGASRFTDRPTIDGRSVGTISLTGRQFGATRPKLADVSMHIDGIFDHVTFGVAMGYLIGRTDGGPTSIPTDPQPIDNVGRIVAHGSLLSGFYIGPEIGAAFTWGAFDLTFGTTAGYRELGVPLVGFDSVPCRGGLCPPQATQNSFFLRPRLAMGIHHGAWGMGGYVAGDLLPERAWSAGAYFESSGDLWRARANVSHAISPQ